MKQHKNQKILSKTARVFALLSATVLVCGAMIGCSAPQPPAEGSCHEWREWVEPEQNEEGEWTEGYCRDTRDPKCNRN